MVNSRSEQIKDHLIMTSTHCDYCKLRIPGGQNPKTMSVHHQCCAIVKRERQNKEDQEAWEAYQNGTPKRE